MFEALPLVVDPPGDLAIATDAADRAAGHWRLPQPELVRFGANAVFVTNQVVLRVSRPTAPMSLALELAERLARAGVRVATLARPDVFHAGDGLEVTAWQRIEHNPSLPVDWQRVGAMVAIVHSIDPTNIAHPLPFCGDFPWWNFEVMLGEADDVDTQARDALVRARHTYAWWSTTARAQRLVLCHGDVHPGNVLVDSNGPVLIDWDLACVGPPEWDHAPLMTWTRRWGGAPGIYEAFSAGYGHPVHEELAAAIAEMRLLAATLMRLRRARLDPTQRDEALRRLRYWRGDTDAPMWQAQ